MRVWSMAMMVCLFLAMTVSAAVDGPLFEASPHYKVGFEPIDVCIADFNNDGINDMACAQYTGDSISVLIGKEDGGYETAAFYTIGSYQYWIEAGNIDSDSDIELVVATWSDVYTLDNDGSGGFGAATQIVGLANSPWKFKLANIDADPVDELIVAHNDFSYTNLTVWENDGSGTFTLDNEYNVGTYQRVLAMGDFDGINGIDIAVGTNAPEFSVLLNDGSGGFSIADTETLTTDPRGMCAADFDENGSIDLAITRYNTLEVWFNNGSGDFSAGPTTGIDGSGYALSAADVDGVNGPDLAMVDDSIYVYFNNGSGSFSSFNTYWVGEGSEALAVGKLDDDNYYDIVAAGFPGNYGDAVGHVGVLFNPDGNGQFSYPVQSHTGDYTMSLCRADFNNDTYIDIATLDWWEDSVRVFLNDGAGNFANSQTQPVGNSPYEVIAAELDGVNTEDLIIGHSDATQNYITVLLSNGDGTFGTPSTYACDLRPRGVFAADFDGSNGLDIASTNTDGQNISILFNNGSGGFGSATNYASVAKNYHSAIEGGDFDGQNGIDIVIPNATNGCVQVYYNDGSGGFGTSLNVGTGDVYDPYQVCVDDLDDNGYDDIIVGSYDSNEVCIMMNNGSGFDATDYYYAGYEQYEIRVSDFDADGSKDIVVLNTESYNFTILFGDGAGNFVDGGHYGIVSDDSEGLAVADFDKDGYPDVAVSNYNHDNISVMFNRYTILTPVTEIVFGDPVPEKFMLSQNYPNPFNPTTTIQYSLPQRAEVSLSVYNLLGQRVKVFYEGVKSAGTYQVTWDGRNNSGRAVATGVYLYQLRAGDFVESRKMLLLK